jgi:hypothetical protein
MFFFAGVKGEKESLKLLNESFYIPPNSRVIMLYHIGLRF